jgi:hypothetical protein
MNGSDAGAQRYSIALGFSVGLARMPSKPDERAGGFDHRERINLEDFA